MTSVGRTGDGHDAGVRGVRARWRVFPRLVRLGWRTSPAAATLLLLLNVAGGLIPTLEVHLLRRLIDAAVAAALGGGVTPALGWAAAWTAASVAQLALNWSVRYAGDTFQERLRAAIEERTYRHAQALPLEAFERPELHDELLRVRRGMEQRFFSTMAFTWGSLRHAVTVLSLLAYFATLHWVLPLVVALGMAAGVFLRQRQQAQRYVLERGQTPDERRFATLDGLLTTRPAAAEIRLFGLGGWLAEAALRVHARLARERLRLAGAESRAAALAHGIATTTYIAAIVLGVVLLAAGGAGIGAYAALFTAVETFQRQLWGLVWNATLIHNDLRYVGDFFALVDRPAPDADAGRRLPPGPVREIRFEEVSFTYPGATQPALRGVSFSLCLGERIALVGENGAGKTTLVRLLMGLYAPTEGRITADGIDLREIAPAAWREQTGGVFQSFQRYQAAVRENVGFGRVEVLDDRPRIEAAAARSGADEVVAALPEGLETLLGKDFHEGHELSVGQWQKLAIARAYLRDAALLVLDEPAAALDARAEAAVYEHFASMAQASTVVLISHRLGSCQLADRILVLRDGRLVEEGTHRALLASGGEYAALYRLQAEWYR